MSTTKQPQQPPIISDAMAIRIAGERERQAAQDAKRSSNPRGGRLQGTGRMRVPKYMP